MQGQGSSERMATYKKGLANFLKGTEFAGEFVRRFEIPYGDKVIPVLYTRPKVWMVRRLLLFI